MEKINLLFYLEEEILKMFLLEIGKIIQIHIFPKIIEMQNTILDNKQENLTFPSSKSSTSLSCILQKINIKKNYMEDIKLI